MSETGKAVFLSYASQDADAAKRICDALRAAGVEVWFDQSELVGGDAWDQKIRKQIKECALLIPIISANTQSRTEGYFRLEWRLGDQRTHLMAKGRPFLLPVVIDSTRDTDAHVPDSFTEVQWSRLPGGETSPAFALRVNALLGGELPLSPTAATGKGGPPPLKSSRTWMVQAALVAAVIGVVAIKQPWRKPESAIAPAVSAQPLAEARRLEQQARALIDDDPLRVRENYRTACELCERATALSPDDAEAWATYARASCTLIRDYNEGGDKAIAAARLRAERAIRLAPDSLEANLAKAQYAIQVGGDGATGERQLQALLRRAPNDRRILRALARAAGELVDRQPEKLAESRQWVERAEALPGGDTLALTELGWGYWGLNRYQELDALLDRVLTRQPTSDAYHLKVMVLGAWGDMDGVLHWLEKVPPAVLSEDRVAAVAIEAYLSKRQPDKALALLARLPREFLEEGRYFSPKSYLAGLALRMAGKPRAAEIEFRSALKTVEDRIVAKPNDARLFNWKGRILAHLGDQAGAAREFETGRELNANPSSTIAPGDLVLLGRYDEAIAAIDAILRRDRSRWPSFFNQLKFSQDFDPLRNDARFVALIARGDGWLREMRFPPATSSGAAAIAPAVDDKSVAVLAFANLSDDKANEYFSEGISEELLNVLAKVPGLKVTARTSSFHFKGKDTPIPEIAQQLGVAYVIEGSVRKQGNQVRITAQLIKAADGFHVWSDTFTRDLKDIFALQDEIAGLIAKNLQLKMGGSLRATRVVNPEAHQLYLRAQAEWKRRRAEGYAQAQILLEQALGLDPEFAPAYAQLANIALVRDDTSVDFDAQGQPVPRVATALAYANRALQLDPESPEAQVSLGGVYSVTRRWADAERALRQAIVLNPNNPTAHHWLARLLEVDGRMDEAIAAIRQAAELDPLASRILDNQALILFHAGRTGEARAAIERALLLQPDSRQALSFKTEILLSTGQREEARPLVAEHLSRALAGTSIDGAEGNIYRVLAGIDDPAKVAAVYERIAAWSAVPRLAAALQLGRSGEALALLEPVKLSYWTTNDLLWNKLFDSIRTKPEFTALLQKTGLAEAHGRVQAWRAAHPPERANAK